MGSVWAFRNRGDWHFVASSKTEAMDMVGQQVAGDQCDVCGASGWVLRGTLAGPLRAVCGPDDIGNTGCGTARVLAIQDEEEVLF